MKRFVFILSILFCTTVFAHTINWHDGNTTTQTTCNAGDNITPPTPIGKYGYHFVEWKRKYTPIEYLQSTGTQYIDTGYIPNINSGMVIDVYSVRADNPVFASTRNSQYYTFGVSANSGRQETDFLVYNGEANTEGKFWRANNIVGDGTGRYIITINKQNFSIETYDGSIYTYSVSNTAYTITSRLLLFGMNDHGTPQPTVTRIYSCKLYDNGVLVRDFIPVLDAYDTPCMYDKVERKYYYNAGTGQFIAGPVISE